MKVTCFIVMDLLRVKDGEGGGGGGGRWRGQGGGCGVWGGRIVKRAGVSKLSGYR